MKNKILALILIAISLSSFSQHDMQSSLYPDNRFLINPANAGDKNQSPFIFLGYRYDFAGISGSLRRPMLAAHSPVSENVGLGAIFSLEQSGIFQYYNIAGSYSYTATFSKKNSLRLGISSGVYFRDIDHSRIKVNNQADDLLKPEYYAGVYFFSGLGLEWKYKNMFVNASVPKVYTAEDNEFLASAIAGAGYDFDILDSKLTPSVFANYWKDNPVRVDLNLLYKVPERFFVLFTFKSDVSASFGGGLNINDLTLSYVYDYTKELTPASKGTHEVMISYTFSKQSFGRGKVLF